MRMRSARLAQRRTVCSETSSFSARILRSFAVPANSSSFSVVRIPRAFSLADIAGPMPAIAVIAYDNAAPPSIRPGERTIIPVRAIRSRVSGGEAGPSRARCHHVRSVDIIKLYHDPPFWPRTAAGCDDLDHDGRRTQARDAASVETMAWLSGESFSERDRQDTTIAAAAQTGGKPCCRAL